MKEEVTVIFENDKVRVEVIKSLGVCSPDGFWYDQEEEEIAVVTKGIATLEFRNGEKTELKGGDKCVLKPHEKHRVSFTSQDCEWVCLFLKD